MEALQGKRLMEANSRVFMQLKLSQPYGQSKQNCLWTNLNDLEQK